MKDIENIEKQLCQMLTVDCIIANSDRHFNNFGFIRNADTLEWEGLAPVYDTGTSLFHDVSIYYLKEFIKPLVLLCSLSLLISFYNQTDSRTCFGPSPGRSREIQVC